jgi:hypothetical protein
VWLLHWKVLGRKSVDEFSMWRFEVIGVYEDSASERGEAEIGLLTESMELGIF